MPTVNPGDNVSVSANAVASRPWWMSWTGASTMAGKAKLPSGHRRLVTLNTGNARAVADYYVAPKSLPLTDAPWRATIYAPNGSYITSTGEGDIPTIGTPVVRIGTNAPSKAVINFPVMKNSPKNILASSFAGWSDGHAEKVDRGMEVTVEFRDKTSGTMRTVFRGMIYQIESGEAITITAYDRMMDLAQYSDQYQSHAGYEQGDTSISRATSGSNYIYTMHNNVGALLTATTEDMLMIDATSAMGHGQMTNTRPRYFIHPLPSINSYTVEVGKPITHVRTKIYVGVIGTHASGLQISATVTYTARARVALYQKVNGAISLVTATSYQTVTCSATTVSGTTSNYTDQTLDWDVNWSVSGSNYYIGVEIIRDGASSATPTLWSSMGGAAYADYTSSKLTFSGDYYTSDDGTTWTAVSSGEHPEVAIQFVHSGSSVNVSSISISGTRLTIPIGAIPYPQVSGYLSVSDAGISLTVSYFISGAAGIQGIVKDLLQWAGLTADVINESMGTTTYYTSSTYEYMTCVLELLKNGNYAIKTSTDEPGKAVVRRRHTISENAVASFTTDPSAQGEQQILKHELTAHWMAEKATQAYIAEDATSSGLPVALETDDALMDNSLAEILQSPLRSVIADNTLGTHDLQANAAGGKMVQLHTNVFEGKMTLAGYRLDVWDFTQAYCGGLPIGINVPEYGASGTAIPTEIVIADGITQVSLDNIRTADRSEIANSMGLSADAISNNASAIPSSVYIFARLNTNEAVSGISAGSVSNVKLYDTSGVVATQSSATYIRVVNDSAGYLHIVAIFPASSAPSGYATVRPIDRVSFTMNGVERIAMFDNPKYAYDGQNVHVDIRVKRA